MGKTASNAKGGVKTKSKVKASNLSNRASISTGFPSSLLEGVTNKSSRPKARLETLLPGHICVLHDFFSRSECEAWVNFMDKDASVEIVKHKATRYIANRECYRYQQNDATMAHRLFERLFTPPYDGADPIIASVLPEFRGEKPVTCNPNLRLYKYGKGMAFGRHIDESCTVPGVGETRLTMLVYLTSCQGGATRFEHDVAFTPETGALLLHVHGDDCLLHEGEAVEAGVKYILRTDLVFSKT